ncbi:ENR1 protein, partial [Prunella himalayana]|nr:ENR1 protein [Prunella himalayana]
MLNHIIRLQALIQVVSNQTTTAIDFLNAQQMQIKTAVYQNHLALEYLLAEECGVCGQF